jgi:hypothetical protein
MQDFLIAFVLGVGVGIAFMLQFGELWKKRMDADLLAANKFTYEELKRARAQVADIIDTRCPCVEAGGSCNCRPQENQDKSNL